MGACAAPSIAEDIGEDAVVGRIFNVEGPVASDAVEGQVYMAAVGIWGDPELTGAGAGTVSFRSAMNLYAVLDELGPDGIDREAILEAFRAGEDEPSFNGHAYTCDGQQVPSLPALCAPQQLLVVRTADGLEELGDWVDVPAILAADGDG